MTVATNGERDQDAWKYASKAMAWYGWGSPVGAGVFLACLGVAALLLRLAVAGL